MTNSTGKLATLAAASALTLAFANIALAEETELTPISQSNQIVTDLGHSKSAKKHSIELGTQLQYFDYKENIPNRPEFKSEERGIVPGVFLGYSVFQSTTPFSLNTHLSYYSTDVHYDGSLQNGTPLTSTSGLSILQIQVTGGYSIVKNSYNDLGIYSGINFRTWNRQLDKALQSPAGSFDEIYSTLSLPVGLKWNHSFSDQFQIGLDGSVGIPLLSKFEIIFPGRMLGQSNDLSLSNFLKTKLSWKFQAPLTYWATHSFGVTFNPFVESIAYENSYIGTLHTPQGSVDFYEPASQTYQAGAQLKVALTF